MKRTAQINRKTNETKITLFLDLDGKNRNQIETGFGFADHMLDLFAFWAGFCLELKCSGDMHIDAHHTLEDIALCLGSAMNEALSDKKGIARVGLGKVPMDEAMCEVCVDISGRPYLVYLGDELLPPVIAGQEADLWREFFKAFCSTARINLHINYLYGKNGHHLLESAFKGCGLALRCAAAISTTEVLSTKGILDQ